MANARVAVFGFLRPKNLRTGDVAMGARIFKGMDISMAMPFEMNLHGNATTSAAKRRFFLNGIGRVFSRELALADPNRLAHVPFGGKCSMHPKCVGEGERLVALACQRQVLVEQIPILRVGAIVDDRPGPLAGVLAAQVRNSLLCYQDLDGMFRMVDVAAKGYDGTDFSVLGR